MSVELQLLTLIGSMAEPFKPKQMVILFVAFLGGALTILSPYILPVMPFVFARAERPFRSHGFPLLLGMAAAFSGVATLAAVGAPG